MDGSYSPRFGGSGALHKNTNNIHYHSYTYPSSAVQNKFNNLEQQNMLIRNLSIELEYLNHENICLKEKLDEANDTIRRYKKAKQLEQEEDTENYHNEDPSVLSSDSTVKATGRTIQIKKTKKKKKKAKKIMKNNDIPKAHEQSTKPSNKHPSMLFRLTSLRNNAKNHSKKNLTFASPFAGNTNNKNNNDKNKIRTMSDNTRKHPIHHTDDDENDEDNNRNCFGNVTRTTSSSPSLSSPCRKSLLGDYQNQITHKSDWREKEEEDTDVSMIATAGSSRTSIATTSSSKRNNGASSSSVVSESLYAV